MTVASGYGRAVFRFLLGDAEDWRRANMTPMLASLRLGIVAVALVALPLTVPHFFSGISGVVSAVALAVAACAWIAWVLYPRDERVFAGATAVLGACGGTLAGISEFSLAIAIGCVVAAVAGSRMRPALSFAITAETTAAFLIAGVAAGAPAGTLVGYPFGLVGFWALCLTRYTSLSRAEQAERMLEQTRRARDAETQAAALSERARIAREIHDVLAHSLAAVSVNLQAAEGLLSELPEKSPELDKAMECVERAGALTREGLAEARRAINALRDTGSPLPEQLASLASAHQAAGDATVDFRVSGSPRPVPPDAGLTVYRTAQEALTNARKHAPGQPVRLTLEFAPAEIAVEVASPLPPEPAGTAERSLANSGGGHGLTGLRERAALSGGSLTAGPRDGQWHVCLRIPA